jgi:3-hydroxyisobutyrate dehydrogenase-like beta-hydroxyacid dehydrogenase
MKKGKSILAITFLICSFSAFSQEQTTGSFKADLNTKDIKTVLKAVADWQVRTPLTHDLAEWTNGALYAGMVEWAGIAGDN